MSTEEAKAYPKQSYENCPVSYRQQELSGHQTRIEKNMDIDDSDPLTGQIGTEQIHRLEHATGHGRRDDNTHWDDGGHFMRGYPADQPFAGISQLPATHSVLRTVMSQKIAEPISSGVVRATMAHTKNTQFCGFREVGQAMLKLLRWG